jgi:hypothetical protein
MIPQADEADGGDDPKQRGATEKEETATKRQPGGSGFRH